MHSITRLRRETCDDQEEKLPHLRPPVIIVGTHADKPVEDITTMKSEIQKGIAGREYEGHVVRPVFSINNTANLHQSRIKKVFRRGHAGNLWVKVLINPSRTKRVLHHACEISFH